MRNSLKKYNVNNVNNKIKRFRKTKKQLGGNCSIKERMEKININNVKHPMARFIKKKVGDKYFLSINSGNNNLLNLDNIYVNCFIERMLEILQFSFTREREYNISIGNYPQGYMHSLSNITNNLKNSRYITNILTDLDLVPLSFLYIELQDTDYDKMWTVCSDKNRRGEGNSSIVVDNTIKEQKKKKRNKLLLEIYNDDVIGRKEEDPRQKDIMAHFLKQGFKNILRGKLSENTKSNLLTQRDDTKIMVLD